MTTVIQSDTTGSFYTKSQFDVRKTRSTRKFLVRNANSKSNMANYDNIVADMKAESGGNTLLGPTVEAGGAIVHPIDDTLPLQTVEVASLGGDKYLVTAQYFIVSGISGLQSNLPQTLSLRSTLYQKKTFEDSNGNWLIPYPFPGCQQQNPNVYAREISMPALRIRLPFFTARNPITGSMGVNRLVGSLNKSTEFAGIYVPANQVRFDGCTMDEYGGIISEGGNAFKFKGYYDFTARPDYFWEQIFDCQLNQVVFSRLEVTDIDRWTINDFQF